MVGGDGQGIPLGKLLKSAAPAEVKLLRRTLATVRVPRKGRGRPRSRLRRVIAAKAYDSDQARRELKRRGSELICPHAGVRRSRTGANCGAIANAGRWNARLRGWEITADWWYAMNTKAKCIRPFSMSPASSSRFGIYETAARVNE